MTNIKIAPAIVILAIINCLILIGFYLADDSEAINTSESSKQISFDIKDATWLFEGTFCSECNKLYNYIEHPTICNKCGMQTKDLYYLVLIKERK